MKCVCLLFVAVITAEFALEAANVPDIIVPPVPIVTQVPAVPGKPSSFPTTGSVIAAAVSPLPPAIVESPAIPTPAKPLSTEAESPVVATAAESSAIAEESPIVVTRISVTANTPAITAQLPALELPNKESTAFAEEFPAGLPIPPGAITNGTDVNPSACAPESDCLSICGPRYYVACNPPGCLCINNCPPRIPPGCRYDRLCAYYCYYETAYPFDKGVVCRAPSGLDQCSCFC